MSSVPISKLPKPPLVDVRCVSKSHRTGGFDVEILSSVTLAIGQGEFVAITGPSGSGKSTLLGLIGTLDAPTSGEVLIDGVQTSTLHRDDIAILRNEKIGFVFQHFNLLPRMSALDQIMLPTLYARHVPNGGFEAAARQRLSDAGLSQYALRLPSELSGGQQQRVAIARALMNSPKLILADEPTGALDQQSGRGIMDQFTRLNAAGITVVVVTHDADVARYARRVIRMQDGRILQDGQASSHLSRMTVTV